MVRKMLEGQKCLVIGSGISGIGAVALLEKYHADVVLYDSSDKLTKEDLEAKLYMIQLLELIGHIVRRVLIY